MSAPLEDLINVNRLVHEPARLAILTVLSKVDRADFKFLQSFTGLAQGNLSGHLAKLEAGGLIQIEKTFKGKYSHTRASLTRDGRQAFDRHWKELEQSRRITDQWFDVRPRRHALGR